MKAPSFALALGAVASLALTPASFAAISCPNRIPATITAPAAEASLECQNAIAKAALSFVKKQLKTDTKCMSKQVPGACPSTKDTEKKQKEAVKARDKVVAACTGALSGLMNSYSAAADPADVASCTLSQNNADGRLLAFKVNGTPGALRSEKNRDKCVKTLNSAGTKYALSALQAINKCLSAQAAGSLALQLTCVGQWSGGSFVGPTDIKTSEALAKALDKLDSSIGKSCGPVSAFNRETIFACPGAVTDDDFKNCIACGTWDSLLNMLQAQYSETGTLVSPGTDALQNAVDASVPNAKLLIKSGLYREDVSITSNVLHSGTQLIGCGGAAEDRPKVQPPTSGGPYLNGIFAAGVDGLVFQSLEASGGWDENGIFVTGAEGVTFRDMLADGGNGAPSCRGGGNDGNACTTAADCPSGVCTDAHSTYGLFPVSSHNVLVETSRATNIRDAAIYTGSNHDQVVRYNTALDSVAGIEIENSTNASVYGNYAGNNVGGLLVFKLPGPVTQRGNLHNVFFNVVDANNVNPNFGIPGTSVAGIPPGSGVVILSVKDCLFHHNLVQKNRSYGFVMVDQEAFDTLTGGALDGEFSHTCDAPDAPFQKCDPDNAAVDCPASSSCSLDQRATGNKVYANTLVDKDGIPTNGTPPIPGTLFPSSVVYATLEEGPGPAYNNNCFNNGVPTNNNPLASTSHFSAVCP